MPRRLAPELGPTGRINQRRDPVTRWAFPNVINSGNEPLRLYTLYGQPEGWNGAHHEGCG